MPYQQNEPKRQPISRYGMDRLGILLIVVALILIVLSFFGANVDPMLFTLPFVVGIALLIYEGWRALSTDLAGRTKENNKLQNLFKGAKDPEERAKRTEKRKEKREDAKQRAEAAREAAARNKAEDKQARAQEEREDPDVVTQHCPTCNQSLRLPRGKGTIRVTCPKCKNAFILHT